MSGHVENERGTLADAIEEKIAHWVRKRDALPVDAPPLQFLAYQKIIDDLVEQKKRAGDG